MILRNEKGVIALASALCFLMLIAAVAVFSLITGRFSITMHMNKRIQSLRNAEAASYVTYQMIREGAWPKPSTLGAGNTSTQTVTFADGKTAAITISGDANSANPRVYPITVKSK